MRSARYLLAAALITTGAATAAAQTTAPQAQVPPPLAGIDEVGPVRSHWAAAAFVGTNIENGESLPSIDERERLSFGGQIGYLWRGIIGGEFLADTGRAFDITDSAFVASGPRLNAYMANLLVAIPFGSQGQFQPFFSGGVGRIEIVTDFTPQLVVTPVADAPIETTTIRQHLPGANIGGGFMGFAGNVGFRADARYYRSGVISELERTGTAGEQLAQALLSDLPFWRASFGLAFQW
jgi:hypothetical protein